MKPHKKFPGTRTYPLSTPDRKKCHNCKDGEVDGGFSKRIKKEIEALEKELQRKLSQTYSKDREKQQQKLREIRQEYKQKLDAKSSEEPGIIGTCFRCGGTGYISTTNNMEL